MQKLGIVVAVSMLTATVANAACVQGDLAGTWQVYSHGWDNAAGGFLWWNRCKVTFNASGTMTAGTCVASKNGEGGPISNGSGTLTVANACTFTAQFTVGGLLNRVVHSTMSKDKEVVTGVGTFSGGAFSFQMSRL